MSNDHKPNPRAVMRKMPRRAEIWRVVDRDKKHNGKKEEREYENSIQAGTRYCIVVSNNTGNMFSPNVEIVFTTTRDKNKLPTHFMTKSTPEPSTVLCEEVTTVPAKDLVKCHGKLAADEVKKLNKCLRVSLGL